MSEKEDHRILLNSLVDMGYTANLAGVSTMSSLLRWGEVDKNPIGNNVGFNPFGDMPKDRWYVFEIGRNCGTVFSADCVKKIEIKGKHAVIYLKG